MANNQPQQAKLNNNLAAPNAVLDTTATPQDKRRVRIVLEDNQDIPPTGQFMSVNGRAYILRAGEEADVPFEVCTVLDAAIASYPIMQGNQVIGTRERKRFPYRIIARDVEQDEPAEPN